MDNGQLFPGTVFVPIIPIRCRKCPGKMEPAKQPKNGLKQRDLTLRDPDEMNPGVNYTACHNNVPKKMMVA